MAKASKSIPPFSTPRDAVVAAFMALLGEKPLDEIGLAEIAGRAGLSLAALRGEFGSRLEILAAFLKQVDRSVLDGIDPDLAGESTKEQLVDILMRRLDVLTPHKQAIRHLSQAARRHPSLALALNRLAVRSQGWMLAAAGIELHGPGGALRAQGMAALFAKVLGAWLDDDDPALARTMRVLDEELDRAGRAARLLGDVERLTAPLRSLLCAPLAFCASRRRERRREEPPRGWRGDDFRDPHVTPV